MKQQRLNLPFHSLEEILNLFHQKVNVLLKNLLENLMLEERSIYLEQQQDSGNGFYTRNLLTKYGAIEGLRVPRVRKKVFFVLLYLLLSSKHFPINKGCRGESKGFAKRNKST